MVLSARAALNERRADEGIDPLAVLVGAGIEGKQQSPARPALGLALLDRLRRVGDGIADIDRLEPLELAETGGGAPNSDRFTACFELGDDAVFAFDQEPHAHRRGMPARRAQATEMRPRRRFLIDVEGLRVIARSKTFDLVGGKRMSSNFGGLTDADVFEIIHVPLVSRFRSSHTLAAP